MAGEHHYHGNQQKSGFRFCPHCGGQLESKRFKKTEPERRVCSMCAFIFFEDPKIAACTIPVIDNRVVLLKRGIEPGYGKWVFPGGFMDRGERVEEAAIRETWEEANLKVEIKRLLNVYSYRGQPTVIIVYLVDVVGGQLVAMDETIDVATFAADEIPWSDLAFESTREALQEYLAL
jgi:ADP-ribose pyrophosphatase YjhB (NUDIX family)